MNVEKRKSIVTEFKGLRIYTSSKNIIQLNIENKLSRDSFEFYENILQHEFLPVLIKNTLLYLYHSKDTIYFFTKKLNFLFKLNIKEIRKSWTSGRFSLTIKLFDNQKDKNFLNLQALVIKFFSKIQREYLLNKILPNTKKFKDLKFQKSLIIKICKDSFSFFNFYNSKFLHKLKRGGLFYYPEVYKIFDIKLNFDYKLFLILSEIGMINKTFNNMFYGIENIWFDSNDLHDAYDQILLSFKRHEDSIKIEGKISKDKIKKTQETFSSNENSNLLLEKLKYDNQLQDDKFLMKAQIDNQSFNDDEFVNIRRHNMVFKRSRTLCNNNLQRGSSYNSYDDMILSRPVYDKIEFNVTVWKYLSREQKILEVNNSGFFVLYKKGKVSIIKN